VKRTLPADTFCSGCTLIATRPETGAAAAVRAFGASSNCPGNVTVELMRRLATRMVFSPMSFCELGLAFTSTPGRWLCPCPCALSWPCS